MINCQVAILGSGCGGLWLQYHLLRQNYSAVVFESEDILGGFASTGGQNRLHNGAMYALVNGEKDRKLILETIKGRQSLIEFAEMFAPGAISKRGQCLYIYPDNKSFDAAADRLQKASALVMTSDPVKLAQPLSRKSAKHEFSDVISLVNNIDFSFVSPEATFDSNALLLALRERIRILQGAILKCKCKPELLNINREGDTWRLSNGKEFQIVCRQLVVACGSRNPLVLDKFLAQADEVKDDDKEDDKSLLNDFKDAANKSLITILPVTLSSHIICLQPELNSMMHIAAIPLGDVTSVSTGIEPADLDDVDDLTVQFNDALRDKDAMETAIGLRMPGLRHVLPLRAHSYMCPKIDNISHRANRFHRDEYGTRHYYWLHPKSLPGICFYTPGKWTISMIAAETLVAHMQHCNMIQNDICNSRTDAQSIFAIAERPIYENQRDSVRWTLEWVHNKVLFTERGK